MLMYLNKESFQVQTPNFLVLQIIQRKYYLKKYISRAEMLEKFNHVH